MISDIDIYFWLMLGCLLTNISLALFVLLSNYKKKVNRLFFLFVGSISLWIIALIFYYYIPNNVLYSGRTTIALGNLILLFGIFFAYAFPDREKPFPRVFFYLLILISSLITYIIIFTNAVVVQETVLSDNTRSTIYGNYYPLFTISVAVYLSIIIGLFIRSYRKRKDIVREQLKFVLTGFLLMALLIVLAVLIIPPLTGSFDIQKTAPLYTLIFFGFTGYAIVSKKLFNLKIVATEIFSSFIVIISFLQLILSKSVSELTYRGLIFLLTAIFVALLIRSVIREINVKEQLELLSHDLARANKNLQKLDKMKSEFLSIASHQLRTPISGIKGYLSMLLEGDFGPINETPKKIINDVYANTERLNGLVNDFLDVSRIERGKMVLEREPTDMPEMIEGVINTLKPDAERKGLEVRFLKPVKTFKKVNVDANKLRQAYLNIIDNSIKYTPSGYIEVKLSDFKQNFVVKIKDTGIGLAKGEADKLFRPFSRAHGSSKYHTTGTGLGLYVVRKVVEYHGGTVTVASPGKGKGTTFIITIPFDQSLVPDPKPEPYLE